MDIVQKKDKFGMTWEGIVKKLAENVNNIITVEGNEKRFPEMQLGEGFPTRMGSIIRYKGSWPPSFEMIRDGLSGTSNNNLRPRCLEACPRCAAPCLQPKSHDLKHDCFHQMCGISGTHYTKSKVLMELTCTARYEVSLQHQRDGYLDIKEMGIYNGDDITYYPYRDFCKHYPKWNAPTKKLSDISDNGVTMKGVKGVAEIIWNKHQSALAKLHTKYLASDKIVVSDYSNIEQVIRELTDFLNQN